MTADNRALFIEFSIWLELLALSLEAGLDFIAALKTLMNLNVQSPVYQKFELFLSRIKLGASKREALRKLQLQWPHPFIEQFCQTLVYGWQHGIPISPLLKELSEQIRSHIFSQQEREIQKKQFKLLLPLFLLILPAVLTVLLTPLIIQLFGEPF